MSRTAFEIEIVDLVKARHPLILVETHEFERVVAILQGIVSDPQPFSRPRALQLYTLSNGVHVPGGTGTATEPVAALRSFVTNQTPTILVGLDIHHFLGAQSRPADATVIRALLDAASELKDGPIPHTILLVAPALTLPPDLEKVVTVVDLPLPEASEIRSVLDEIVDANRSSIEVRLTPDERERLVQAALGLTRWEAENAFARAIATDRVLDASHIGLVLDEKRQTIRKSGMLEFISSTGSIEDVGGLENLKRWLRKRNGSWLADAAGWSVPAPKGVLITGIPGCGKSLTAKCVSGLWGLPLLRLDVGRVYSGLVGSSELNMRNALKLAEAVSPSILWIDEIEKGFGSGTGGDSGTSARVFATFLTWMQEKTRPVFVIATANRIDAIPPEFIRKGRFDEVFFVDLPTLSERQAIWRLHLDRRLVDRPLLAGATAWGEDLVRELAAASEGFSGAEIEQAVVSACFEAFADRRTMEPRDLHRAIVNTVALSVTQSEQIATIRGWASTRAVAATSRDDLAAYEATPKAGAPSDVSTWRGGRTIEF